MNFVPQYDKELGWMQDIGIWIQSHSNMLNHHLLLSQIQNWKHQTKVKPKVKITKLCWKLKSFLHNVYARVTRRKCKNWSERSMVTHKVKGERYLTNLKKEAPTKRAYWQIGKWTKSKDIRLDFKMKLQQVEWQHSTVMLHYLKEITFKLIASPVIIEQKRGLNIKSAVHAPIE